MLIIAGYKKSDTMVCPPAAPAEAGPILEYFEDNYIDRILRHDGRYRKIASAVTFHHPNIWKFLDVIKTEQIYESALYRNIAYAKCVR